MNNRRGPSKKKVVLDEEEEEGDDDDAIDLDGLQTIPEDFAMPTVMVGGKGKANRKGTVREGGIVKRAASVDRKENKQPAAGMLSTTSLDPEDWRPTPEEYKKMSSKEKRQLRNKISARNFRVRRKGACPVLPFSPENFAALTPAQSISRRSRAISQNVTGSSMRSAPSWAA